MQRFKVKPDVYREFIKQLKIEDIYLKKATIEVFPENIPENFAVQNRLTDNIKLINEGTESFQISHKFKYQMVDENNKDSIIAKINFELLLIYSSSKTINKDIFAVFKDMNVPHNSWPYAREFIHSTIVKLGLPPIILPLYKRL